jgi:uncharacterized protein with ATP-grasp and redox domains
MKTYIDCIPCFLRQTLEILRSAVDDEEARWEIMQRVLTEVSQYDLRRTPPEIGAFIHALVREKTGVADPYRQAKDHSNRLALELYPSLRQRVTSSADPWETSLRLAIAGNIIDLGFKKDVNLADIQRSIDESLVQSLPDGASQRLKEAVTQAKSILYLGDNAGEIVFDRVFIEGMPKEKITFVVRGHPIINDATMEDAQAVGMTDLVHVIDNGSDIPGTLLSGCSQEFIEHYNRADLIIAKGQGNYETLDDPGKSICFLFRVKCPVVARDAGLEMGRIAVSWKG